jgi:hypothetical protein
MTTRLFTIRTTVRYAYSSIEAVCPRCGWRTDQLGHEINCLRKEPTLITNAQPVEFDRPLNEAEKHLLAGAAVLRVAERCGVTEEAAAEALDHYADRGETYWKADAVQVCFIVAGNVIIRSTREALAWYAMVLDAVEE